MPRVGIEGGGDTPSRTLFFPLAGWLAIAVYMLLRGWRGGPVLAVGLLLAFAMDLLVELVRFLAVPDVQNLGRTQIVYVYLVAYALLVSAGAGAAAAVLRFRVFLPLSFLAVGAAASAMVLGIPLAAVALAAGAGLGWVFASWRPTLVVPSRAGTLAVLGSALVVGLLLRVGLVLSIWGSAGAAYPTASATGPEYDRVAATIIAGSPITDSASDFNGYVLFLVAVYETVGRAFVAIGTLQAMLGTLVVLAAYFVARRVTGDTAIALVTALATAVDSLLITSSATILREAISVPAFAGTLAFLLEATASSSRRRRILFIGAAGILSGILVAASIPHAAFVPVLAFWLAWTVRARGVPLSRALVTAAAFVILAAITAAPTFAFRGLYPSTPSTSRITVAWSYVQPWDQMLGVWFSPQELVTILLERPGEVAMAELDSVPKNADGLLFHSVHNRFDPFFLVAHTRLAATIETYMLVAILLGGVVLALGHRSSKEGRLLVALTLGYVILVEIAIVSSRLGFRHRAPYDMLFLMFFIVGSVHLLRSASRAVREVAARTRRSAR